MEHPEPNRTPTLPPDLYRRALNMLRGVLPRPLIGNPADTTERDMDAMEEVTSMRPANALEIALAVQFVATNALGMDIMQVITDNPVDALKHWAASANMLRQSRGALSSLQRAQAARMKQARITEPVARRFDPMQTQLLRIDAVAEDLPPVASASNSETPSRLAGNETRRPGSRHDQPPGAGTVCT